jgi:CheY-like chemotaxis protein
MPNKVPGQSTGRAIPTVALIDDDRFAIRYYAQAVEQDAGAIVRHYTSVVAFIEALNSGVTFDLIITDVMMPPEGAFSAEETHDGLLTGVKLIESIREAGIPCPLIILSNIFGPARFDMINNHFIDDGTITLLRKMDTDPFALAAIVKDQLERLAGKRVSTGVWRSLIDSLQLKPNFMGLGIDLKELLKTKKEK